MFDKTCNDDSSFRASAEHVLDGLKPAPHKGSGLHLTRTATKIIDSDLANISNDLLRDGGTLIYQPIPTGSSWDEVSLLFIFSVGPGCIVSGMEIRRASDNGLHTKAVGDHVGNAYGQIRQPLTATHLEIFEAFYQDCTAEFRPRAS